jgi:thioredoxin
MIRLAPGVRQEEKMSDILQAVTDASFQSDVIEASKTQPVVVDFWADWCRPCIMLTPTVEEIAREHAGKVKVVKLNVDENMNVPGKYSIRGIPTLLVFKGGQVADQIVGAQPKENIVKVIERHIS